MGVKHNSYGPDGADSSALAGAGPDFSLETAVLAEQAAAGVADARVCGVDEVGRGPLAGPVVAAAAVLTATAAEALAAAGAADSKALSAARRVELRAAIAALEAEGALQLGLAAASAPEIGALNIHHATHLAMRRAIARLPQPPSFALIDGKLAPQGLACPCRAVVKGDARALSIACAAIVAKEARDEAMRRLARRHPAYGWERNMGYPTAEHRAALAAHGATAHHRRGFRPVMDALARPAA